MDILFLSATAVVWVLALLMLGKSRRETQQIRLQLEQQNTSMEKIKQDVRALCAAGAGVDERVAKLENRSRTLTEKHQLLAQRDRAERPYDQAIRLVQQGASMEQLMKVCELSRGEAELILRMHALDEAG